MLEALSSKLSKYLSPQVYESIFSGAQTVEISAKRKKLTVFFSDIAGFTETTDHLEAEELTDVLNQYLTEMSKIALAHGATIDKYIGDAMLLFFGDPETQGHAGGRQGLRDDGDRNAAPHARARTGMAGARARAAVPDQDRHQHRLLPPWATSAAVIAWTTRSIGNQVNLAARLQSAAEPGGILLSYETNALVQGIVLTEEYPPMTVKGFVRPINVYKVLGTYQELVDDGRVVLQERDGLRVLVDLTKQVSSEAIKVLEEVLAELKRRSS